MTKQQKIIKNIIATVFLVFAIIWAADLTFQVMAGDPTATLTTAEKLRATVIYFNIFIIFVMGIFPFFSQHRPVLIAAIILAFIGVVFWIAFWWEIISIINIVFLLLAGAFDYWIFRVYKALS